MNEFLDKLSKIRSGLEKVHDLSMRILIGLVDFVNLPDSGKKDLVGRLILVGSILAGFSANLLDFTTVNKKTFFGLLVFFLFSSILYYIIIQKGYYINKQTGIGIIKHYLFIIFIFVISFMISISFSGVLITLLLTAMADNPDISTVVNYYSFFTFIIWAALMKKTRETVILFYIVIIIFYFGLYFHLLNLHH